MSKKARRRPSWGKYRQKYGKWAVYYKPIKSMYGLECEEYLVQCLIEEIQKGTQNV